MDASEGEPTGRGEQASPAASDQAPAEQGAGWWPHARALLVTLHIVAVIVLALPSPGGDGMSRKGWKNPTVQAEFTAWSGRLSALGVELTAAELEERLWGFARRYVAWHNGAKRPFKPYATYAGTIQSWRMFVAPHRYPARLHVDIRDAPGAAWRPVQIARSREHDWRGGQLNHDRTRAMLFRYGWPQYRRHYRSFARWLAVQAAHDFPEASHVRVRWYGFRTPTPEEVRRGEIPEGKYRDTIVKPLDPLRTKEPGE